MSLTSLAALERHRLEFGAGAADTKLALLKQLARTRLGSAPAVMRLHEALCFIRAYPDNAAVLAQVQAMLGGFAGRADLRAHRAPLADSGIAGTPVHYRFFAGQAQWLGQRWPNNLRLDRDDIDAETRIARALPPLLTLAEAHALIELKLSGYAALDRLRGSNETDAVFLLRRIAAMPGNCFTREAYSDTMDASFVLAPGPDTPSRTAAHFARAPVVFRREPPPRGRTDLRAEMARAPRSVRRMSVSDGEVIVDLARGAMVTRARSLEAFSFADVRDVWSVDDRDGLAFAFVGVVPQRRHAVASYYGGLTPRNGVPIGYLQSDIVGRSAALSFNTFDTFRGGEAAFTLRRLADRHLFFDLEPAQPQPLLPLAELGLQTGAALSARAGSNREHAVDEASAELLRHCGLVSLRGFSPDQREAWRRLAPILTLLDLGAWRDDERRALVDLIHAKGGRSERAYVARYLAHPKLDAALSQRAHARVD